MADRGVHTRAQDGIVWERHRGMEYYLMRKDEVVTICNLTEDGQMISWSDRFRNPELAPLEHRTHRAYLRRWWQNRQIPVSQGHLESMLTEKGLADSGEFLIRNLGLSLTDYYWMKPVGSVLKWKDVSLFRNDFKENILQSIDAGWNKTPRSFTPNSSLRGELEKSWLIRKGERYLVKGNHGELSSESINEVIASEFHKAQGYDNFTEYSLLRIKDRPYDFGCCAQAFTDENRELISAYAVLTSEKKPSGMSPYEHLIRLGGAHGMDQDQFRADLEYQILSDYLLTNTDRHMENIGILRDADSLKWIRMAPIFDTGKAFAAGGVVPYTEESMLWKSTVSSPRSERFSDSSGTKAESIWRGCCRPMWFDRNMKQTVKYHPAGSNISSDCIRKK
jgi:hypothetical protein